MENTRTHELSHELRVPPLGRSRTGRQYKSVDSWAILLVTLRSSFTFIYGVFFLNFKLMKRLKEMRNECLFTPHPGNTSLLNIWASVSPGKKDILLHNHTIVTIPWKKSALPQYNPHTDFPKMFFVTVWFFKSRIQSTFMHHCISLVSMSVVFIILTQSPASLCMWQRILCRIQARCRSGYSTSGFMWLFLLD